MEAHQYRDSGGGSAVVTDHVEMTIAQQLAALVWRICCFGDPERRKKPQATAAGDDLPPGKAATVPEQPLAGPATDSAYDQPGNEATTTPEPPPDGTTAMATVEPETTGRSGEVADDDDRLPEDYQHILGRLVAPVKYSSTAELDRIFRKNQLLIDNSSASFTLGIHGEKCYMSSSRDFIIAWIDDPNYYRQYWRRIRYANSRFPEVVLLVNVCWFTLYCKFNLRDLSDGTVYSVYLVYDCTDDLSGLDDTQECLVTVGDRESGRNVSLGSLEDEEEDEEGDERPSRSMAPIGVPQVRRDEWMEVEIGELSVEERRDQIVEVRVEQTRELHWKSGIIVEGIELRAKDTQEDN